MGELERFARSLLARGGKVSVVLWLEEDRPADPVAASTLKEDIRRELSWLNPKVLVASRALVAGRPIEGLSVESLAGVGT